MNNPPPLHPKRKIPAKKSVIFLDENFVLLNKLNRRPHPKIFPKITIGTLFSHYLLDFFSPFVNDFFIFFQIKFLENPVKKSRKNTECKTNNDDGFMHFEKS